MLWRLAVKVQRGGPIAPNTAIKLPLTQRHMADATGLTSIHFNRIIRRLREQGVVRLSRKTMVIEDPRALAAIACVDDLQAAPLEEQLRRRG